MHVGNGLLIGVYDFEVAVYGLDSHVATIAGNALIVDACAGIEEVESFERHGSMIEIFVDQIEIR